MHHVEWYSKCTCWLLLLIEACFNGVDYVVLSCVNATTAFVMSFVMYVWKSVSFLHSVLDNAEGGETGLYEVPRLLLFGIGISLASLNMRSTIDAYKLLQVYLVV